MHKFLKNLFGLSENEVEAKLSLGMQALIEAKVDTEFRRLQRENEAYLSKVKGKQLWLWRGAFALVVVIVIPILCWIVTPNEIGNLVRDEVNQKMLEPELERSINGLIQTKASTYVDARFLPLKRQMDALSSQLADLQATLNKANLVSTELAGKTGLAEQRIETLNKLVSDANLSLADVKAREDFTVTMICAANDDRRAFEKLMSIGDDQSSPYHDLAVQIVIRIGTNVPLMLDYPTADLKAFGIPNIDALTIADYQTYYSHQMRPDARKLLLYKLWNSNTISKYDKLTFIFSRIKDESSIDTTMCAMHYADIDSKVNMLIFKTDQYLDWWEKNKDRIKAESDKPQSPPKT